MESEASSDAPVEHPMPGDDLRPRGADSEDEDSVADAEHGDEAEDAVAGQLQDGVISAEDSEDVSSRPG